MNTEGVKFFPFPKISPSAFDSTSVSNPKLIFTKSTLNRVIFIQGVPNYKFIMCVYEDLSKKLSSNLLQGFKQLLELLSTRSQLTTGEYTLEKGHNTTRHAGRPSKVF